MLGEGGWNEAVRNGQRIKNESHKWLDKLSVEFVFFFLTLTCLAPPDITF